MLLFIPLLISAQNGNLSNNEIIDLVDKINPIPVSISFQNNLEVNNNGGHLQGVQYYEHNQNDYYFLSGSSDSYSYYAVVKIGKEKSVISVNKILDKPFKHAGGFQIYKNLMAIGIEDNSGRKKSKVFVYQINDPEEPPVKPIKIIERTGAYERATAGCVGVIEIKGNLLVIVGDWDTKHLDFYIIEKGKLFSDNEPFKLVYSIDTEKLDKSAWINDSWLSYQNINFIKDSSGGLYLAGMASDDDEENILDLYKIELEDYSIFNLKKIQSKIFTKSEVSKFQLGAGIYHSNNKIKIFSCGAHIKNELKIVVYE